MKNFINNKKKRVVVSRNWDKSKISQDKKEKKKKTAAAISPNLVIHSKISLSPQATYNREIYAFKRLERIFLFLISVPTLSRDPTRSFE